MIFLLNFPKWEDLYRFWVGFSETGIFNVDNLLAIDL